MISPTFDSEKRKFCPHRYALSKRSNLSIVFEVLVVNSFLRDKYVFNVVFRNQGSFYQIRRQSNLDSSHNIVKDILFNTKNVIIFKNNLAISFIPANLY